MNALLGIFAALLLPPVGQELTVLHASDSQARSFFGECVAMSGTTVVAGSSRHVVAAQASGSVYVYGGTGTNWVQQAELTASDARAKDSFGCSVGVDHDTLVVGAYGDDHVDNSNADEGSAYVFVRSGSAWSQQAKLVASDAAAGDLFGQRVAISGDTVAIGAPNADALGVDSGAVYVFVRSGTTWSQQAKLVASDGVANDTFGHSVALDGDTLVVGADQHAAGAPNSGAAYVFVRSGTTWTQQAELAASDGAENDAFGRSVSVSLDSIAVGAPQRADGKTASGCAYVFDRSGTAWSQSAKLAASDAIPLANFAQSVSLSQGVLVAGAGNDKGVGTCSGSAYVFLRSASGWAQNQKMLASTPARGDFFGACVAAVGFTVAIGAPSRDDTNVDSGAVYVLTADVPGWYARRGPDHPPLGKPPR